ncbi:MAG TPA: hypothetical protein VJZ25_05575 [Gemmatimonadaceae bacterium]|nr:hypothetical protein [Gemmatimonadaceae bacterium]
MKRQGPNRSTLFLFAVSAFFVIACGRGDDRAGNGRGNTNAAGADTVSEVALNEDGLGQVQIGMQLSEAVDMGLLSENPNLKPECDYVFPAVGAGIPEGVSVMVVHGRIARIDVDTGVVTTEEGAKVGDTEERLRSLYGDDARVTPHKYIAKGHYFTVAGDSASAGKALVFETDGQQVERFRAGRMPEVGWVEACS